MEDWRLYWSPQSSAALRVVLALRAKGMLPANMPICQPNRAHPHPSARGSPHSWLPQPGAATATRTPSRRRTAAASSSTASDL